MKHDYENEFVLRLLTIIALLALIFIGSFAVYRFIEGNIKVAIADTLMVLIALGCALWARKTGQVFIAGLIVSIMLTLGAAFIALMLGFNGAIWFYPLIVFMSHLVSAVVAVVMSLAVITVPLVKEAALSGSVFSSPAQMFSFLMTALATMIFSIIFANRIRRHRRMLHDLASQDSLTGLFNRRSFERELHIAISSKQRLKIDYGLIIFDIDHFKEINDRWGHDEGDRLLRELSYQLRETVRLSDRAFRFGGDEFILILPNTGMKGLQTVCKKIHSRFPQTLNCNGEPVTVSIGAARLRDGENAESWFRRADSCLLQAKQTGRNRFVLDKE